MKIYIMGICGTAMSHVALLLKQMGHAVCGSDNHFFDPIADLLKRNAIQTWEGYNVERLQEIHPDTVIVGNVVSRGNEEIEYLLDTRAFPFYSFPEFLEQQLFKHRDIWVITGTHGKTTTTAMTAFLMQTICDVGYFIGGIPHNFDTGCNLGNTSAPFIIEGDEYDTAFFDKRSKFFHYQPRTLIINNLEFDHADIFRDLQDIKRSFYQLTRQLPRNGHLVLNGDDPHVLALLPCPWTQVHTVGFNDNNDWQIQNVTNVPTGTSFDLRHPGTYKTSRIQIPLLGNFNVRNAAMAYVACWVNGFNISEEAIKHFKGVQRRQTLLKISDDVLLFEDFGHHPTAIHATLKSLKAVYPEHHIVACFEPSCNTSSSKFFQDQANFAFQFAHEVWLLPPKAKLYTDRFVGRLTLLDEGQMKVSLEKEKVKIHLLKNYDALKNCLHQVTGKTLICCFSNGPLSTFLHTLI